jgi:hypothetical protein
MDNKDLKRTNEKARRKLTESEQHKMGLEKENTKLRVAEISARDECFNAGFAKATAQVNAQDFRGQLEVAAQECDRLKYGVPDIETRQRGSES